MPTPLDLPITPPVAILVQDAPDVSGALAPVQQAAVAVNAALLSSIKQAVDSAMGDQSKVAKALQQFVDGHLLTAQQATEIVQNGLDAHILGQLGSVAALAAQVPGFSPPTVASLSGASSLPPPPPPPSTTPIISPMGQVFPPGSGGSGGEITPTPTPSNCLHAKWLLPDGTYAVAQWEPGVTSPPNAPSTWELYDGPKPCSAPFLPDLPPIKPGPLPPPTVLPPVSQPTPISVLNPVMTPPQSTAGPCPSLVSPPAGNVAKVVTVQGVRMPTGPVATGTFIGHCLPGYFAPYKQGFDTIVPVWVKQASKMYPCVLAPGAYTGLNYVVLAYPEGKGSKAWQVNWNLRDGDVYWIDDFPDGSQPPLPIAQPTPLPPIDYPPPVLGTGGGGGGTGFGPITGAPIINNPISGPTPTPVSPTPGPITPTPISPTPTPPGPTPTPYPPPTYPTPISPTPVSPTPPPAYPTPPPPGPTPTPPTPPTPTPPGPPQPPPTYPSPPAPPPPTYPSPPAPPYPPITGAPIINNPIGGGGGSCPTPVVNVPAPIVNVTCPSPSPLPPTGNPPVDVGNPPIGQPPPGQPVKHPSKVKSTPLPANTWPSFCDIDFNKSIDGITQQLTQGGTFDLLKAIGARNDDGTTNYENWFPQFLGSFSDDVATGVVYMCDQLSKLVNGEVQLGGSPVIAFLAPGLLRMIAQAIHHFTGVRFEGLEHKISYWFDYLSPDLMPETGEFNEMRMSGVISAKQWRAGVRANNRCESWQKLVMDAKRERITYHELWRLNKLGLIQGGVSQSDIRSYGFRKLSDIDDVHNSFAAWPGFEEALDWGTKGVVNDEYAAKVGLDVGLDEMMTDELKRYAASHGTEGALLARRWRAHWELPSVEFTLDAFHRLRPGRVDPELVLAPEQIKQLLQANGVPPGYQDRLIELSRPKITRREMSVLYKMGAISKDEVVARLRDIGYREEFGKAIVDAFQLSKVSQMANMPEAKAYVKGGMDALELSPILKQFGASPQDQQLIFERLDREVKANAQQRIIDSLHKRFLNGDIPINLLVGVLSQAGVEVSTAQKWGEQWIAEFQAKEKHVEAGTLLQWYEAGLLPKTDLVTRLARLGYQPNDVSGIVSMADYRIQQTQTKAVAAKKKADDAAKARIKRQADQEAKQAAASKRMLEKLVGATNKVIVELEVHEKISVDEARKLVEDAIKKYRDLPNSTDAGAVSFIQTAWQIHSKKGGPTWISVVDDLIKNIKDKTNGSSV